MKVAKWATGPSLDAEVGAPVDGSMDMGMRMDSGMMPIASPVPQPMNPEQELKALKGQSQMLAQELTDIQRRIEELEKKSK
jgi:hypothetical protein